MYRIVNPDRNLLERIVVCDGGSSDRQCITALQKLASWEKVEILSHPLPRFNKSRLINQGILHSRGEYLLISDADIIWNAATLQSLLNCVKKKKNAIACVQNVKESDPQAEVLRRARYTYEIQVKDGIASIKIIPENLRDRQQRPGCGLICTRKTPLTALGGYKEVFQGWGWEDRDLLMRAELLGFEIHGTGTIAHLSHGDNLRDRGDRDSIISARNCNIITSIHSLSQSLHGDLEECTSKASPYLKIQLVQFPKLLQLPP